MLSKRKPAKISAYETLIKYNITSLPVPTKYSNGIKIFTLQFLAEYHNQDISEYFNVFGYRGFVCYEPHYNNYVIFINDDDPEDLQRWCISTAIGYIENYKFKSKYGFSISESSLYINDFTYTYTCPDCILERDHINKPEQIIELCKIPFNKAREKSKRLKIVFKSKNDLTNKLETLICNLIPSHSQINSEEVQIK